MSCAPPKPAELKAPWKTVPEFPADSYDPAEEPASKPQTLKGVALPSGGVMPSVFVKSSPKVDPYMVLSYARGDIIGWHTLFSPMYGLMSSTQTELHAYETPCPCGCGTKWYSALQLAYSGNKWKVLKTPDASVIGLLSASPEKTSGQQESGEDSITAVGKSAHEGVGKGKAGGSESAGSPSKSPSSVWPDLSHEGSPTKVTFRLPSSAKATDSIIYATKGEMIQATNIKYFNKYYLPKGFKLSDYFHQFDFFSLCDPTGQVNVGGLDCEAANKYIKEGWTIRSITQPGVPSA